MVDDLSRRGFLVGGAVLFITGCGRTARSSASAADRSAIPPYAGSLRTATAAGLWYRVEAGDTLTSISRRSGVDIADISRANGLTTPQLQPGIQLWLPGSAGITAEPVALDGDGAGGPPRTAARRPGTYDLVDRSEWAKTPVKGNNYAMNGVKRITIHHTGEHPGLEGIPEIEVIQRIERYHQNERHWAAIGYHYLVGKTGKVYEGRPVKYQGAHVSGENEHNLGISVIGDFMHQLPNADQLGALEAFLSDTRKRFGVAKSRIYGHRELGNSVCPGDALFRWVTGYRA
jgi:LysM repeat protein